jgi:omega-6 fatty acid desaturase (delta-12 desaturase)
VISTDTPQPSPSVLTADTTLRDIIKTLPADCFEKNMTRAWLGVASSLTAAVVGYCLLTVLPWYLLPLGWIFTGTALTGFFVLGHDCGHRSFAKKLWVNDLVGHLCFLPLLYPFHGWRFKHDHHHVHTNKMGEDNAWYPFTDEIFAAVSPLERVFYRAIRTRFWWFGSVIHWALLHFNPKLYPERQRSQVALSATVVVIFAAIAFPVLIWFTGVGGWVNYFLMPWLVYHFWMSTFTIVHHTMPEIAFHFPEQWQAAADQLTGTVHCDYPAWVEFLCHDINVHIPHHISTGIPFYNLRRAHASLKQHWQPYLYETAFSWSLMKTIGDRCHLYDAEHNYKVFS